MSEHLVIRETRRPLTWFFNEESCQYVRREDDGKMNAFIDGKFLPDPYILTMKLQDTMRKGGNTNGRMSADPVTYKLWDHWREFNGNSNPKL